MSVISIENCLKVIPNKFELAVLASHRSKDLLFGDSTNLSSNKSDPTCRYIDKPHVLAIREIGEGLCNLDELRRSFYNETKKIILSKDTGDKTNSKLVFDNIDESASLSHIDSMISSEGSMLDKESDSAILDDDYEDNCIDNDSISEYANDTHEEL